MRFSRSGVISHTVPRPFTGFPSASTIVPETENVFAGTSASVTGDASTPNAIVTGVAPPESTVPG